MISQEAFRRVVEQQAAKGAKVLLLLGRAGDGCKVAFKYVGKGYVVASPEPARDPADEARFVEFFKTGGFAAGEPVPLPDTAFISGDTRRNLAEWGELLSKIDPAIVECIAEIEPADAMPRGDTAH